MLEGGTRQTDFFQEPPVVRYKMARDPGQKLIRLSAARAKVRLGYASVFAVCLSGFLAGIVVFWISAAVYFLSATLSWLSTSSTFFVALANELARFFCIRVFDAEGMSGAMANLAAISTTIGATGAIAGMILRYSIRREPSDSFFKTKRRVPVDILPFLVFFAYPCLRSGNPFGVYLFPALIMAFLWRCWYGIILSLVSSFDVDKLMPKPV